MISTFVTRILPSRSVGGAISLGLLLVLAALAIMEHEASPLRSLRRYLQPIALALMVLFVFIVIFQTVAAMQGWDL
jgi:uncharacterized membrane protein